MLDRALIVAVLACGLGAAARLASTGPIAPSDGVGADVSELRFHDHARAGLPLPPERTVVMVFNSNCAHCVRHAEAWSGWLDANPTVSTLAVSSEEIETAQSFADEYRWNTTVLQLERSLSKPLTRAFTSRTPWIHVVSDSGIIEASFYGGDLDSLDRVLSSHSTEVVRAQDD